MNRTGSCLALVFAAVLMTACEAGAPLPSAVDSEVGGISAGQDMGAVSASSAQCRNVSGGLEGNVFVGSVSSGDLEGGVYAYAAPVVLPRGRMLHLETFHVFDLGDGTLMTVDRGVQAPVDPPVYRLNNHYVIVGGTGAYADASGFLSVHGTLIIDFAGLDPRNGSISATYRGRVCH